MTKEQAIKEIKEVLQKHDIKVSDLGEAINKPSESTKVLYEYSILDAYNGYEVYEDVIKADLEDPYDNFLEKITKDPLVLEACANSIVEAIEGGFLTEDILCFSIYMTESVTESACVIESEYTFSVDTKNISLDVEVNWVGC